MLGEAKIGTREGECQKAERKQRVRFCEAQAINGSRRGAEGVLKSSDMHGCAWWKGCRKQRPKTPFSAAFSQIPRYMWLVAKATLRTCASQASQIIKEIIRRIRQQMRLRKDRAVKIRKTEEVKKRKTNDVR
jgi:hypothetical protein